MTFMVSIPLNFITKISLQDGNSEIDESEFFEITSSIINQLIGQNGACPEEQLKKLTKVSELLKIDLE